MEIPQLSTQCLRRVSVYMTDIQFAVTFHAAVSWNCPRGVRNPARNAENVNAVSVRREGVNPLAQQTDRTISCRRIGLCSIPHRRACQRTTLFVHQPHQTRAGPGRSMPDVAEVAAETVLVKYSTPLAVQRCASGGCSVFVNLCNTIITRCHADCGSMPIAFEIARKQVVHLGRSQAPIPLLTIHRCSPHLRIRWGIAKRRVA